MGMISTLSDSVAPNPQEIKDSGTKKKRIIGILHS